MPTPNPRAEPQPTDWAKAQPEKLPAPTYWPFVLALGLTAYVLGPAHDLDYPGGGALITFIIALAGWINLLRHE
ncbi:MAG: hypothetical protein WKG07_49560 [Hymenobacter sp.]